MQVRVPQASQPGRAAQAKQRLLQDLQAPLYTSAWQPMPTAGSPVLFGTSDTLAPHSRGHNKRLVVVPAGFDWVTYPEQVGRDRGVLLLLLAGSLRLVD